MQTHPHWQELGPLCHTSSDFVIIIRRLIRKVICSLAEDILEAVVDRANYRRHFCHGGIKMFYSGPLMNQCPIKSPLLYANEYGAYASTARHPQTLFSSECRTPDHLDEDQCRFTSFLF